MREFLLKAGFVLAIIGVILCIFGRAEIISLFKEPVDIFQDGLDSAGDIKTGLPIDTDISILVDNFGNEEITESNSGSKREYAYYILPVFVGNYDTYYVAIKTSVNGPDYKKYQEITEETLAYLYGESDTYGSTFIHTTGIIRKLDKEKYEYLREWFEQSGYFANESDIDKYVLPYILDNESAATRISIGIAALSLLGGGLILTVISLLAGRKYAARLKELKKSEGRIITINGLPFSIASMGDVDRLIWSGKNEKAMKTLISQYRATPGEAQEIISNWTRYTGMY